jgi:hypothetical protein
LIGCLEQLQQQIDKGIERETTLDHGEQLQRKIDKGTERETRRGHARIEAGDVVAR